MDSDGAAALSPEAAAEMVARLVGGIRSVYLGEREPVESIVACLIAGGHCLIEDVPGVGKTLLAGAIARSIDAGFRRVQLTPDMLPGDIIGTTVLDRETPAFQFRPGPVFTNILLADEINRTTPRTQTALLEAMSDGSVTVDGVTHAMAEPFFVLATQNPYEFEGTYLLPENQLDRFLMRVSLGYPGAESEVDLLDLRPAQNALPALEPVIGTEEVLALRRAVDGVAMSRELRAYVVAIAAATRASDEIVVGLSPRGSLALAQAARATALMDGRGFVTPDDVYACARPVCSHRVIVRGVAAGTAPERTGEVVMGAVAGVRAPV